MIVGVYFLDYFSHALQLFLDLVHQKRVFSEERRCFVSDGTESLRKDDVQGVPDGVCSLGVVDIGDSLRFRVVEQLEEEAFDRPGYFDVLYTLNVLFLVADLHKSKLIH